MAVQLYCKVVADPDLQIGGVGHPDPEISRGGTRGCLSPLHSPLV